MDPYQYPTTGKPPQRPPPPSPKKEIQIQGPRPSALRLHQGSHKIKKPPLPPQRQPVIIYAVSPKIIHAEESNFMAVVQRLTGLSSDDFSHDGSVSPAARLAATEKASPRELTRPSTINDSSNDDLMEIIEELDFGQFPGILSPAPAMLPPVPTGFFSPVSTDANISQSFWNDNYSMSPLFTASPSGFFSGSGIVSPLHSPDIFSSLFMDL
ncbi:PREDICTED: protein MKS1-like [Populus euphratica]|uniref:Protein MKS1-like n=1 Tax=Populus euphratica TaxID=75702 RepID=A0AAJ6UMS4_POPEU|nr:PREDICTED: protein MKS1-like [Populus euphratica]